MLACGCFSDYALPPLAQGFECLYGQALLVGGFADAKSVQDLRNEKAQNAKILQVVAYPRYQFTVSERDSDPTSLRYGLPTVYKVNMARSQDLKETSNTHTTRKSIGADFLKHRRAQTETASWILPGMTSPVDETFAGAWDNGFTGWAAALQS